MEPVRVETDPILTSVGVTPGALDARVVAAAWPPAVVVVAPDDDAMEQLANSATTSTALATPAIRRVLELPVPICMLPPTLVMVPLAGTIRLPDRSSDDPSDSPCSKSLLLYTPTLGATGGAAGAEGNPNRVLRALYDNRVRVRGAGGRGSCSTPSSFRPPHDARPAGGAAE